MSSDFETGYTQLNSESPSFRIKEQTLVEGVLEKLSHNVLKKWETRRFELDIPKKTLKYFLGDEMKGEYSELSSVESVDAVSRDRPHRFVVRGKSARSKDKQISELHINVDSDLAKKQWMEAIKLSISGDTQIDNLKISGDAQTDVVEKRRSIENILIERVTEVNQTREEVEFEKVGGHSIMVLYLENLNLLSQLLGIYTTYLLLIHLMPDSTDGPTSCENTFFIYKNPETGICVGSEIGLIVVAIHLVIDVVFASIISNQIDFKKRLFHFDVDFDDVYVPSLDRTSGDDVITYIASQLLFYAMCMSLLTIFMVETYGAELRNVMLSTIGIQPWMLIGVKNAGVELCFDKKSSNVYSLFLAIEALSVWLYQIVSFLEINQDVLFLVNLVSLVMGTSKLRSSTPDDMVFAAAAMNFTIFIGTTLPSSCHILVKFLWLSLAVLSLLSEIMRIEELRDPLLWAVGIGFVVVLVIALCNLLFSWLFHWIFGASSSSDASSDDTSASTLLELFYDTCYLGPSMVFALSTLVVLCRATILTKSKVLKPLWWEGFHLFGPVIAIFLFVAFYAKWSIAEILEPYNNVFTLMVCMAVYFISPSLPAVISSTINSVAILLNPMEYLEANEVALER